MNPHASKLEYGKFDSSIYPSIHDPQPHTHTRNATPQKQTTHSPAASPSTTPNAPLHFLGYRTNHHRFHKRWLDNSRNPPPAHSHFSGLCVSDCRFAGAAADCSDCCCCSHGWGVGSYLERPLRTGMVVGCELR